MAEIRIGCSGFFYDHWRGNFYPEDLSKNHWLEFYAKKFSSVELNVTFYHLPEREAFSKWFASTPDDFLFSLKGSRFITHIKKLKDCAEPVEAFFSRAAVLREKLGVILWQLPPAFNADPNRLSEFLEILKPYKMRNSFEFRNKTWINKKVYSVLEKQNAALCMADHPDFLKDLPSTADFVYVRRHGKEGSYATSYSTEELKEDAKFIRSQIRKKKDVFMYFNNDAHGYAAKNAAELTALLKKSR
ncbi:MAG: DUF72 domain-containing protein [Nitrospirota bacterium]